MTLTDLETCAEEITTAARTLARDGHSGGYSAGLPDHLRPVQRTLIANASQVLALAGQPADFVRQLALYNQLLACLRWLGEFQVLACIPLDEPVPFEDVADIAGVPECRLRRLVRPLFTIGFLCEPSPGHVAHSVLSRQFVTQPALLDAILFMSETLAPSASTMGIQTRRFGASEQAEESAWNLALGSGSPFAACLQQRPKVKRQLGAYLSYVSSAIDTAVGDTLTRMNWHSLGMATVVHVGAQSPSLVVALAPQFPSLRFLVQTEPKTESASIPLHLRTRITWGTRLSTATQPVVDAAVYLISIPFPSPQSPAIEITMRVTQALRAHVEVLRNNPDARLILTLPMPSTTKSMDAAARAAVSLSDLALLQLTNGAPLNMGEIRDLLRNRSDGLVVMRELRSPTNAVIAFEIQYHVDNDDNRF
ncbi:aflS/ pathway regulator [Aspergillus bombycis]|uniref:AflS/ pathway regulator n=1 Tax=Aspergillus bombycis TaxID=109264 RepID=A0A1F8A6L4_9EURO|nr:aflS/ pathway regulator [Aspergillus bombycis]OGM47420.1 aflS/ pathway regulator [Aspergillus bombycis]